MWEMFCIYSRNYDMNMCSWRTCRNNVSMKMQQFKSDRLSFYRIGQNPVSCGTPYPSAFWVVTSSRCRSSSLSIFNLKMKVTEKTWQTLNCAWTWRQTRSVWQAVTSESWLLVWLLPKAAFLLFSWEKNSGFTILAFACERRLWLIFKQTRTQLELFWKTSPSSSAGRLDLEQNVSPTLSQTHHR